MAEYQQQPMQPMPTTMEGDWENGLCSHVCGGSCTTCLGAWFCPCFLYGRSDQRLKLFPETNRDRFSSLDTGCLIFCGASCFHAGWLVTLLKRMDLRERFGIQGNGCVDCLASYFCTPCALAQMETELKEKAEKAVQSGGAVPGDIKEGQYASHAPADGMAYNHPGPPPAY